MPLAESLSLALSIFVAQFSCGEQEELNVEIQAFLLYENLTLEQMSNFVRRSLTGDQSRHFITS